jgi:hypothetical protein
MSEGNHEIETVADVFEADAQALQVSPAASTGVPQRPASQSTVDVLADLDRVLAATPEWAHMVPPLNRKLIVAVAAEIRRLRALIAIPREGE